MSAGTVQPGVTGRRNRGAAEAPPSEAGHEAEEPVGEGEAEAGVAEGVYFSKVPSKDVWHAYDRDDNPIGRVYKSATDGRWHVKIGRDDAPVTSASSTGGKMWLAGYFFGCQERHGGAIEGAREAVPVIGSGPGHVATGSLPTADHSTNASGDAMV